MKISPPLLPVLLLALLAGAAPAQILERSKVVPADGVVDAEFGYSTSLDAGIIAVGARHDDDNGIDSGSLYLYQVDSGNLIMKVTASDGVAGDAFGFSVSMASGMVAVGAPKDDDRGTDSGAVYLFDSVTGLELHKLVPNDGQAGDEFGFDVALDGGVLAVGAKWDDDNGQDSGSLYLYDAVSGQLLRKVLPNDGAASDNFGEAVDLSQGIVAVGAHGNDDLGFLSGSAYLFDVATGTQLFKLLAADGGTNDFFGSAIAIDDGIVAVGAWSDSLVFDHSGSAYLFDATTGVQTAKIAPADGSDRDHFGISIAIDSGLVAIGADGDDSQGFDAGSAYLFDAQTGCQVHKLFASDAEVLDEFGTSVAVDDGWVAVGVPRDDDAGFSSGAVYLYEPFLVTTIGVPGGSMDFRISGATPVSPVALAYAMGTGSHSLSNPLTGNLVLTGLSSQAFAVGFTGSADGEGDLVLTVPVPAGVAGRFSLQAIDGASDSVSNVLDL